MSKTGTRRLTSPSPTPPSGQGEDSRWQAVFLSPSFQTAATLDCSEKQVETNAEGTGMCPGVLSIPSSLVLPRHQRGRGQSGGTTGLAANISLQKEGAPCSQAVRWPCLPSDLI